MRFRLHYGRTFRGVNRWSVERTRETTDRRGSLMIWLGHRVIGVVWSRSG